VAVCVVVEGVLQRQPDEGGEQAADQRVRDLLVERRGEQPVEGLEDDLHDALVDADAEVTQRLIGTRGHRQLHESQRRRLPERVPQQVEGALDVALAFRKTREGPLVGEPLALQQMFERGGDEQHLGGVVVLLRTTRDPGPAGHLGRRSAGPAELDQALHRRVEQASPRLGPTLLLGPGDRGRVVPAEAMTAASTH
jgi:hypothetical protein